jgi:phosphoenolpyruvate carboxykinase (ATP)
MLESGTKSRSVGTDSFGIPKGKAHWNVSPGALAEQALKLGQAKKTTSGALAIDTGEFTGRSPKDKFTVKDALTQDAVWWNQFNIPFSPDKFAQLHQKMLQYLEGKEFYVRDVYACADPRYRLRVRVVNEYAWSNLFVYNMFIRPTEQELGNFEPEWLVLNAPGFHADPAVDGTRQHNFSIIDFSRKVILIGGSGYTGEIKKGIFTVLNFILPHQQNVLAMHCSANVGAAGDTAIFSSSTSKAAATPRPST